MKFILTVLKKIDKIPLSEKAKKEEKLLLNFLELLIVISTKKSH